MPKIVQDFHKAVIIATTNKNKDALTFGFKELAEAIYFVSEQVTEEVEKMDAIKEALNEGYLTEDGATLRIYDIESYLDLYEETEDDDV